jgi:hypothetical protein
MSKKTQNLHNAELFQDLSEMIEQSQKQIAKVANSALTLLFWNVGNRISNEILNNERAAYGKQIVATISAQ